MMLSPSACRMGVFTRRKLPAAVAQRPHLLGSSRSFVLSADLFLKPRLPTARLGLAADKEKSVWTSHRLLSRVGTRAGNRWKSTAVASYDSDSDGGGDDLEIRTKGFVAAAQLRTAEKLSHDEDWMINLGRSNENEPLIGPRNGEWFTGLEPRNCPGTFFLF